MHKLVTHLRCFGAYILFFLLTFIGLHSVHSVTIASNQLQPEVDEHRSMLNTSTGLGQEKVHGSLGPQSRTERGVEAAVYSHPYYLNQYSHHHDHVEPIYEEIPSPYIVKVVAPRRRSKDAGIAELLLVLAPLAAIPLIGSAALTTFTTLFATGAYGAYGKRRRKRNIVSRDRFTSGITDPRLFIDQKDHYIQKWTDYGYGYGYGRFDNYTTKPYDSLHTDPTEIFNSEKGWKAMQFRHINGHSPKKQLFRLSFGDATNWKQLDPHAFSDNTSGVNGIPLMHNTSPMNAQRNVSTMVTVLEKFPYKEMVRSSYRRGHNVERKGDNEDAVGKWDPKNAHEKSHPYHRNADVGFDFIIKHYNDSRDAEEYKKKDKKIWNNAAKLESESNTHGSNIFRKIDIRDLSAEASSDALKSMESTGVSGERAKKSGDRLDFNTRIPFLSNPYMDDITKGDSSREIHELDIIQKYLNKMGRPDYNDEIIATYLSCNGMLSAGNHCLERLTCQFSDPNSGIKQLEKDVASLVIYSLLKNNHIHDEFKTRLQRAALFGRDNSGRCTIYDCPKTGDHPTKRRR